MVKSTSMYPTKHFSHVNIGLLSLTYLLYFYTPLTWLLLSSLRMLLVSFVSSSWRSHLIPYSLSANASSFHSYPYASFFLTHCLHILTLSIVYLLYQILTLFTTYLLYQILTLSTKASYTLASISFISISLSQLQFHSYQFHYHYFNFIRLNSFHSFQ